MNVGDSAIQPNDDAEQQQAGDDDGAGADPAGQRARRRPSRSRW